MTPDRFVREARPADAAAVARIQVLAWRTAYAGLVPDEVLEEVTSAAAEERWRDRWRESMQRPPTGRHRLLVADDAGDVAGFAAFGPATDPDRWPRTDAELYALHVDPDRTRRGHGSRLIHAVIDTLREDGFTTACTWVLEADTATADFLRSTGWAPDGARRALDMGPRIPTLRLHTMI